LKGKIIVLGEERQVIFVPKSARHLNPIGRHREGENHKQYPYKRVGRVTERSYWVKTVYSQAIAPQ